MAKARRSPRLTSKALEELGIIGVLRVQELDRHAPIQQRVVRFPDGRHPTTRDLTNQAVTPAEHALAASRAHSRLTSSSASATRSPCRRRISRSACAWTRLMYAPVTSTYTGRNTTLSAPTMRTATSRTIVYPACPSA